MKSFNILKIMAYQIQVKFSNTSTSDSAGEPTMNQVGNLLARDRRFEKLGITEGTTMAGFRERVCIWALAAN